MHKRTRDQNKLIILERIGMNEEACSMTNKMFPLPLIVNRFVLVLSWSDISHDFLSLIEIVCEVPGVSNDQVLKVDISGKK